MFVCLFLVSHSNRDNNISDKAAAAAVTPKRRGRPMRKAGWGIKTFQIIIIYYCPIPLPPLSLSLSLYIYIYIYSYLILFISIDLASYVDR